MTYKRRKDARPAEILDAAFKAFAEKSFAKTSMSDIAKRAGVSRPTLYLYFDSKEKIFAALIEDRFASVVLNHNNPSSTGEMPADVQLERLLRLIIHQITRSEVSPLLRMLITEGPNFPEILTAYKTFIVDPGQRLLKGLLARGVHEGAFGRNALTLDPKVLVAPGLMSVVWTSLFGEHDPIDTTNLADGYLAVLMPGLSAGARE